MSSLDDLAEDVVKFGQLVSYWPKATYPVHIAGLGGRTVDDARRLRDQLTEALKYIAEGGDCR